MGRILLSLREARSALKNTNISWWTYGLISCFALSSWITVNGIWSELPVIVLYAPEKWSLASYIVVIIQLGNIGPLLFSLANGLRPHFFTEKFTIYVLILIGIFSCVLLSLFWKRTSTINGTHHSTALMVLVFTLALVDCTSSVVFLTFMALYDPRYITALYIGESFSGFIPGLVAIIQGSPRTPCNTSYNHTSSNSTTSLGSDSGLLFGADIYFVILFAMMLFSGLAFLGLNWLHFAKQEQKNVHVLFVNIDSDVDSENEDSSINIVSDDQNESPITDSDTILNKTSSSNISRKHIVLFCMQAIVSSFSFGIIPTLSPYAFEPYGNTVYHIVASLGPITSAIICFIMMWLKKISFRSVSVGFMIYLPCAIYLIVLACQSPTPWLYTSHLGATIAIIVGLSATMISMFIRLTISIIMREESRRALYWCGMSIQIGSFVGAFGIFPFVNIIHTFHTANAC